MSASDVGLVRGTPPQASAGYAPPAEDALVGAAIGGDARAFAALYDRHVDAVYRQVYFLVGSRADAEDLTQQVFLNAWRAIGRYQQTGAPFGAWLATIVHNTAVGHRRRSRPTAGLDDDQPAVARWGNPEASALAGHDQAAIRGALRQLKPDQQRVILMRFLEDIEYAAIAAALGKSEGNVRVIAHRGLVELRRLLARRLGQA
jgi:RNA polymerase sigma-70 factor (ECF subfamily)